MGQVADIGVDRQSCFNSLNADYCVWDQPNLTPFIFNWVSGLTLYPQNRTEYHSDKGLQIYQWDQKKTWFINLEIPLLTNRIILHSTCCTWCWKFVSLLDSNEIVGTGCCQFPGSVICIQNGSHWNYGWNTCLLSWEGWKCNPWPRVPILHSRNRVVNFCISAIFLQLGIFWLHQFA